MCGIVGAIRSGGGLSSELVRTMAAGMAYRGPDSCGEWVDESGKVAFGHRRLSIIDLSPLGHQPMTSSTGRYTITFNGEIYNYRELGRALRRPLKGGSDTEVMLECFEEYGVTESVARFVGMFAFAVWDREERSVTVVRDRLGVKPLLYGWCGDTCIFTSDMRSLAGHPEWRPEISAEATALYLQYGYVPAPWSIYKGMMKLSAGHMVKMSVEGLHAGVPLEPVRYWDIPEGDPDRASREMEVRVEDLLQELESLIVQAVTLRLVSDVPLGAFLSGGVDSSLVVAMMQRLSSSPVKTFSIGFGEAKFNEAPFAKAVAQHLGTDHVELMVTEKMARDVVPLLQNIVDEPFGDSSLIPTYLVSKLARQHVTVSLSGDGGDELFGGYDRFGLMHSLMKVRDALPSPLRGLGMLAARTLPLSTIDLAQTGLRKLGVFPFDLQYPGEKFRRVIELLQIEQNREMYYFGTRHWRRGEEVVTAISSVPDVYRVSETRDPRRMMRAADLALYLPDDILTKVDRASMAVSLEAREPLLDHRLVEFAFSLPTKLLYRDGRGKWPLRAILEQYVPKALVDRPKQGFSVPLDAWLRGDLREWADALLTPQSLEEGGLAVKPIRIMWEEQVRGTRNRSHLLWDVLMYQDWRKRSL